MDVVPAAIRTIKSNIHSISLVHISVQLSRNTLKANFRFIANILTGQRCFDNSLFGLRAYGSHSMTSYNYWRAFVAIRG